MFCNDYYYTNIMPSVIIGTENIIKLCVKFNVARLVYTSTALVNLIYYMNKGTFSIIVNQTECKAKTPSSDRGFIFPGFAASKLRAEKLVLQSYGVKLDNGEGMY